MKILHHLSRSHAANNRNEGTLWNLEFQVLQLKRLLLNFPCLPFGDTIRRRLASGGVKPQLLLPIFTPK
jgi:hypothetical protein